jgi:phosphoglycolate phosphatase-like HAD superfamily hydrolase
MGSKVEKVLVLDFDGIITDLNVDWKLVISKLSQHFGHEIQNLIIFWKESFGTEAFNESSKLVEKYELKALSKARPYDDVEPFLKSFNGRKYVASLQSQKVLDLFLEKYGLKRHFTQVLGRDNFGCKRRQLEYIIKREKDKDIIFIDDSLTNILECENLKVHKILFQREKGITLLDLLPKIK